MVFGKMGHMTPAADNDVFPFIEAWTEPGEGGFFVHYRLKFYLRWGPIHWGANASHAVSVVGGDTISKKFPIWSDNAIGDQYFTLDKGTLWVPCSTKQSNVKVTWQNNNMSVSFGDNSFTGLKAECYVTGQPL